MVVTLFPVERNRLCLRAGPGSAIIALALLTVTAAAIWLTQHVETRDGEPVLLPVVWTAILVGLVVLGTIGVILETRTWVILDRSAAEITIERGLFRRKKACVSLAQVERIAIRQRVEPDDDDGGGPEELKRPRITLVLALILKTGEELNVVQGMPGGTEGMSIVRQLERFRQSAPPDPPTGTTRG